jgi:hypothetical protein
MTKKVYTNPKAGQPLITTISSDCKTPLMTVKYCNVLKPFYFPNSPSTPRYSVTCLFDPIKEKEFLKTILTIEKNEGVESVLKNETIKKSGEYIMTGKIIMKFQGKDKIPVYIQDGHGLEEIDMQDELGQDENVVVIYDIMRYTKKNSAQTEHGINFKPIGIIFYPKEDTE